MGLSRTVTEINGDFSRKSPIFLAARVFNAPADGVPLGIWYRVRGPETQNDGATRMVKDV